MMELIWSLHITKLTVQGLLALHKLASWTGLKVCYCCQAFVSFSLCVQSQLLLAGCHYIACVTRQALRLPVKLPIIRGPLALFSRAPQPCEGRKHLICR